MPSFTQLQVELITLYLALHHPRTPWYAKVIALVVVAYAFSPIDLIPDFSPVLGYLDDALLLPVGFWLARRLIPAEILAESRAQAQAEWEAPKPVSWVGAVLVVFLWAVALALTFLAALAVKEKLGKQ